VTFRNAWLGIVTALFLPGCAAKPPAARPTPAARLALPPAAAEITRVRELPFRRDVAVHDASRAAFKRVLRRIMARDEAPSALPTLKAFGFLSPDAVASREAEVRLQAEQLLALYVPEERAIYLREAGLKTPELRESTLIHELVHAAQDDNFGMTAMSDVATPEDEQLARRAVYEGDAMVVTWATLGLRAGKTADAAIAEHEFGARAASGAAGNLQELESSPELARANPLVRAEMTFPYGAGTFFVAQAFRAGGPQLVSRIFHHLPVSTEQVLHPTKYFAGEMPVPVAVPALPSGWRKVADGHMGELRTRAFLELTLPMERSIPASEGWGGDTFLIATPPGVDRPAIFWSTVWDDDASALRFVRALEAATRCEGDARACPFGPTFQRRRGRRVAWVRGLDDGGLYIDALLALPGAPIAAVPPHGHVVLPLEKKADADVVIPRPAGDPSLALPHLGIRTVIPEGFDMLRSQTSDLLISQRGELRGRASIAHSAGPFDAAYERTMRATLTATWASSFDLASDDAVDVDLPIGHGRELRWKIDHGRGTIRLAMIPVCDGAQVLLVLRIARDDEMKATLTRWSATIEPIGPRPPPLCAEPAR
jgi:hypothetical protein